MKPAAAVSPLVDFVLHHLQVKTNVCSRQKHEIGYTLVPRTVPDYNLIYVTRGTAVWILNSVEHVLRDGDLIVVPPHLHHHGFARTRRITIGSLHVEATLPGGQDVFALLRPPRLHRFEPDTPLDTYVRGALAEWDRPNDRDTQLMVRAWSRLVTLELFRQSATQGSLDPRPLDPVIADVLRHITDRVAEAVTLDEVADHAGYTPQHLNRLFRRELGVTPLQHHARLRMERAAQLLRESPLTVAGVAAEVGIDDPYYFSRLFKQHFRLSPTDYRGGAEAGS